MSIYSILTVLIIFLYALSDIRLLNSFNLSFTVISSGGFIPSASLSEIFTTNFGQRSAVLVFKEEKVLLTSQHRLLIDDYSWEIPGGRVDSGESFEDAAIRECYEETGYICRAISPFISFHPGLDTLYNPTQVFLCQDFYKKEEKDLHETEETKWFSLKKIKTLLEDGFFKDSLTIIGIQALLLKRVEKKI